MFAGVSLAALAAPLHAQTAPSATSSSERSTANVLISPAYRADAHDRLIVDFRAGRVDAATALRTLQTWAITTTMEDAARSRVAADGVSIATGAGDWDASIAFARSAGIDRLPLYALDPLIAAARRNGDRTTQAAAIDRWLALAPGDFNARVQRAVLLSDQRRMDEAGDALDRLEPESLQPIERRLAWLDARGALAEARGDWLGALRFSQEVLKLRLDDRNARRNTAFLLARVQAAPTAVTLLESPLFTDLESASLRQEALGERVSWAVAERDARDDPARFAALDALVADMQQLDADLAARLARTPPDADAWRAVTQRLGADLVLTLFERGQLANTLERFDRLQAEGAVPWYSKAIAAGAHARLRRPERAIPLYEAALTEGGNRVRVPSDIHTGLVYAYLDTGRFRDADALMDRLIAATPRVQRLSPEPGRPNNEYGDVLGLRALIDLYSDRFNTAQRQFDTLVDLAPQNESYRVGEARVLRARARPDRAVIRLEEFVAGRPDTIEGRAVLAEALLDAGEHSRADTLVVELERNYPEATATRSARRTRDTVLAPRFDLEVNASRGGGTLVNREWLADARLSSGWFADRRLRLFAREVYGRADIPTGAPVPVAGGEAATSVYPRLSRPGIGLEWRDGRHGASAELHRTSSSPAGESERTGVAVGVTARVGDPWRLGARFDSNTFDLPWRARQAGIGARFAALDGSYVWNESRSVDASLQQYRFTDGNRRNGGVLAWRERWIGGPRWQFETRLSAEANRNSSEGRPYFNPRREESLFIDTRQRLLTWKNDDRSLTQTLDAGVGTYRQDGFGAGGIWRVTYAHEWRWSAGNLLRYGVSTGRRPYDGARESRRDAFLQLSFPLP